MPEEQTPFVHQDGSATPAHGRTPAARLLGPLLGGQVSELQRELALRERLYPGWINNGRLRVATASDQLRLIALAIESLQLLQEPRVNTTVVALKRLTPDMQALVSDIAIELATPSLGRQNLANDLRKRLEGRS